VRRDFVLPLAKVHLDDSTSVDGVPFVWIHHNTEETRVGVDELGAETDFQVPEDRGVIQEGQVSHVFAHLKLGRVDLANFGGLEGFLLVSAHDNSLGAIILSKHALEVVSLVIGAPVRLLGIVRLHGILPLHVQGDDEVWARILIGSR